MFYKELNVIITLFYLLCFTTRYAYDENFDEALERLLAYK